MSEAPPGASGSAPDPSKLLLPLPLSTADNETLEALRRQCPFARSLLDRLLAVAAAANTYGVGGELMAHTLVALMAGDRGEVRPFRRLPPM